MMKKTHKKMVFSLFLLFLITITNNISTIHGESEEGGGGSEYEIKYKRPDSVTYTYGSYSGGSLSNLDNLDDGSYSAESERPPWNFNYILEITFTFTSPIEIHEICLNFYVQEMGGNDALYVNLIYESGYEYSLGIVDEGNTAYTRTNFPVGSITGIRFSRSKFLDYFYCDFDYIYVQYRDYT